MKNWYQFFTSVSIWYWFFTFVKNEYQFFTGVKNWYQFFTFVKIEHLFFTSEKNRSSPSQMVRMRTNSSQLKIRKMWHLSTDVRPPILSKNDHTQISHFPKVKNWYQFFHGVKFAKCEICGSTQLWPKICEPHCNYGLRARVGQSHYILIITSHGYNWSHEDVSHTTFYHQLPRSRSQLWLKPGQ